MKRHLFCISVLTLTLLVLSSCSSPSAQTSDVPPTNTPSSEPAATSPAETSSEPAGADLKALVTSFPAEHVLLSETDAKVTVLAYDEDLSAEVLSALSTQTTPENWAELTAQWEADALSISQNVPGQNTVFSVVSDEDSSTIFATFINGKQTYNLFSTEEPYSENPPTISLEEFNAIQTGMTYQEVFDIVGSRGELLSETDLGLGDQYYSAMYMWEGEGMVGANANVLFQGGVVVSKSQIGLE